MSFNIFGSVPKDVIKVGYISTDRGFVDGISICEANEYAKLNPGVQFIFKTREEIKYLNINEVNKLTSDDIISSGSTCSGIQYATECGPSKAYFYGGGGIGVQGNPVIGTDGALLAVDLIHGGYGYQYPPIVEVKDNCGKGAGAVTRAVLGEVVETVEYYDQEGDFEEYEICESTDVGFGRRYDPEGKDIGEWNPYLYANLSEDPIAREIQEYQDFLEQLENPWWTTRRKVPLKVTTENKESRTKFDVKFSSWDEFMNSYAISPVSPSNVKGSDFAGIPYAFEWEEDFPFDGEYVFRGLCDNKAELYIDNVKIDDLRQSNDSPNVVKKDIKAGVHRIRLDLLNIPFKEAPPEVKKPPTKAPVELRIVCHAGGGFGGLKDTPKQDKVGKVLVGNGKDGAPGLAPGSSNKTSASGGGAGLRSDVSLASGATLDGAESAITNTLLPSGQFTGEPTRAWILFGGLKSTRNTFSSLGNYIPFNGNAFYDVKTGYGYGGTIHLRGNREAGTNDLYIYPERSTGGSGAARISFNGKKQDYTKPGTYEFVVPEGVTSLDLVCIGGGGSGFNNTFMPRDLPTPTYSKGSLKDTGGSGGAFAYDTIEVTPGTKLKIVVGAGGSVLKDSSSNGGDTYIEIVGGSTSKVTSTSTSKSSTVTVTTKKNIFNTIDYINKADRQLWRIYPPKGKDSDFFQQYAISPFNELDSVSNTDSYAGTHVIRWESIDFPADGNYNIELMCDDNVTLYIGNRAGEGRSGIGNGLVSVDAGGDEVIISKKGFSAPGQSTGKSLETKFFKAGRYRIRAELEQSAGEPFANGNPMALAINIATSVVENDIISAKSWNENPMGVALTIEAPKVKIDIPKEPIPQQEGRCPNNPIWTTRFPNAKEKWYPVKYSGNPQGPQIERWSRFMNRYAMSPIQPLSRPGTDGGGIVYRNSWDLDIPYDGFYALKSTIDNAGRILIDGQIVAYADYIRGDGRKNISTPINVFRSMVGFDDSFGGSDLRSGPGFFGYEVDYPRARAQGFTDTDIRNYLEKEYKGQIGSLMKEKLNDPNWGRSTAVLSSQTPGQIFNWRTENPKSHKIFLTKGRHTIEVEVENRRTENYEFFEKKIFSTKDWLVPPPSPKEKTKVNIGIICHAGGGFGGLKDTPKQDKVGKVLVGKGSDGLPGTAPGNLNQTTATGGGSGLRNGASSASGAALDGTESSITNAILPSGPFAGEPTRAWCAFGDKRGAIFSAGGNRYIPFNGNAIFDVKTGYGYGGSMHLKGNRETGTNDRFVYPERSAGGNGAARISFSGKTQDYTKPGTYEFVVPEGVTSLDLVCIGGGGSGYSESSLPVGLGGVAQVQYLLDTLKDTGGSGGAFAYDTIEVTPGTKLKIVVGAGGAYADKNSSNGGDTYIQITGSVTATTSVVSTPITPTTIEGITYAGPTPLANYKGDFISPLLSDVNANPNEEIQGKTWIFRWTNVDFPDTGQYTLESEADDLLIIRIDDVEVGQAKIFNGRQKTNFNATKGKRVVELELSNTRVENTSFATNPVLAFAQITKKIRRITGVSASWRQNPIGISAMLIPPPCPKLVRGKGVVTDVIVDDPGNGNPSPGGGGYPVTLRLKKVEVLDGGINYRCGEDVITVTPDNGAVLDYRCDTFGRITEVIVVKPGLGFTTYPEITIGPPPGAPGAPGAPGDRLPTGINATFALQFEVVRDPIVTTPEKLIQVTDLVGLKQTGYVDGRSYYGAVFFKDGIKYAGFYETPGDLVQVYDTLQESITAQVTTAPSAIQRQGTDVTSNDPRLNLPGTPENLI